MISFTKLNFKNTEIQFNKTEHTFSKFKTYFHRNQQAQKRNSDIEKVTSVRLRNKPYTVVSPLSCFGSETLKMCGQKVVVNNLLGVAFNFL